MEREKLSEEIGWGLTNLLLNCGRFSTFPGSTFDNESFSLLRKPKEKMKDRVVWTLPFTLWSRESRHILTAISSINYKLYRFCHIVNFEILIYIRRHWIEGNIVQ